MSNLITRCALLATILVASSGFAQNKLNIDPQDPDTFYSDEVKDWLANRLNKKPQKKPKQNSQQQEQSAAQQSADGTQPPEESQESDGQQEQEQSQEQSETPPDSQSETPPEGEQSKDAQQEQETESKAQGQGQPSQGTQQSEPGPMETVIMVVSGSAEQEKPEPRDEDFKPNGNIRISRGNPLVCLFLGHVVLTKLAPTLNTQHMHPTFDFLDKFLAHAGCTTLDGPYATIRQIHRNAITALPQWYANFKTLTHQDVARAYNEAGILRSLLSALRQVGENPAFDAMIGHLDKIRSGLEALDASTPEQRRVMDLYRNLPPTGRSYLRGRFAFQDVNDSAQTLALGAALMNGSLWSIEFVASLIKDAQFKAHFRDDVESYRSTQTWVDDSQKRVGKDMLPFVHARELSRVVRGQPGKEIEDNIVEGTAYVLKTKLRSNVASSVGSKRDLTTITVLGLDVSGSMDGGRSDFQAAFATAFVLNALSEKNQAGLASHQVVIFPFDNIVHSPIWITKPKEAFALLQDYQSTLRNRNGGTNIGECLLKALDLIKEKARRSNVSFKRANIVLMTDGESHIDIDAIKAKRATIKHAVQLFIVNWAEANPLLKQIAEDKTIGFDRGVFESYTDNEISTRLRAKSTSQPGLSTSLSPERIPMSLRSEIEVGDSLAQGIVDRHQRHCDTDALLAFLNSKVLNGYGSNVSEHAKQFNAYLRKHHAFLKVEKQFLHCFGPMLKRFLEVELRPNSSRDIVELKETDRLLKALANA